MGASASVKDGYWSADGCESQERGGNGKAGSSAFSSSSSPAEPGAPCWYAGLQGGEEPRRIQELIGALVCKFVIPAMPRLFFI